MKILLSKFVPWDIEGCCTLDLEGRQHGTSRGAGWTSWGGAIRPRGVAHLGPQGAPSWDLEGRHTDLEGQSHGTSRGTAMGPCGAAHGPRGAGPWDHNVLWRYPSRSVRHPLRSHGGAPQGPRGSTPRGPRGTNFETKISKFRWFLGPSKTSFPTPHYCPKYEV